MNIKNFMKSKYGIGLVIIAVLAVGFVVFYGRSSDINLAGTYGIDEVTVYRSPSCGCCSLYVTYLENYGVGVEVKVRSDLTMIKERHNIPHSLRSCHTSVVGDHVVEGHVPMEAIVSALENETVSSIALPGMPSGSPGMSGSRSQPFTIYSFDNGKKKLFMKI